ncbi:MAG: hypothetical protein JWM34_2470, partial [Ilumatobacteraceae bacterium]|nr:hypothetical protein [Ilumatobacteraceae bacterium]
MPYWLEPASAGTFMSGGTHMRQRSISWVALVSVLALAGTACGKDRSSSSSTSAAAVTTAAAPTTTAATATTTAATATGSSTAATSGGTAETTGTSAATVATDAATTTTVPAGPMFGDAPWPCGKGDGNNTDDGTEVGVTKDSISIAGGDDAGYTGAPGLDHEITDAMKALVAKCNELGGINGRQIKFNYYDAQLLNVGPAIQGACDDKNFFL